MKEVNIYRPECWITVPMSPINPYVPISFSVEKRKR